MKIRGVFQDDLSDFYCRFGCWASSSFGRSSCQISILQVGEDTPDPTVGWSPGPTPSSVDGLEVSPDPVVGWNSIQRSGFGDHLESLHLPSSGWRKLQRISFVAYSEVQLLWDSCWKRILRCASGAATRPLQITTTRPTKPKRKLMKTKPVRSTLSQESKG